jgi:hypothetical protein
MVRILKTFYYFDKEVHMKRLTVFFAIVISVLFGCKTKTVEPNQENEISGTIHLSQGSSYSGVLVSLENTNITSLSGSDGKWNINPPEVGIYNLIFSKSGYSQYPIYNYQYTGKHTDLGEIDMFTSPSFQISTFHAYMKNDSTINLSATIYDSIPSPQGIMCFLGKTRTVSSNPHTYDIDLFLYSNNNTLSFSTEYVVRFEHGSTYYCVAYPIGSRATFPFMGYEDSITHKAVYTNLGARSVNVDSIFFN